MADAALVLSGALMGLAGLPHCLAMCGASSTGVVRACAAPNEGTAAGVAFQVGRLAGYAAAGALAASGLAALRWLGESSAVLRPLWSLMHVAALALGLWLLWRGQQPVWLANWPRCQRAKPAYTKAGMGQRQGRWQQMSGPTRALTAGMAWVAWPCGLLQSALIVAALARTPAAGAAVMAAFALASSPALLAFGGLMGRRGGARWVQRSLNALGGRDSFLAVRLAGLGLALGSTWALGHGMWQRVAAFCAGA